MGATTPTTADGDVNRAINQFQDAADAAAVKSLETATAVTEINSRDNAIKKISPA